jgi:hypothetical protein
MDMLIVPLHAITAVGHLSVVLDSNVPTVPILTFVKLVKLKIPTTEPMFLSKLEFPFHPFPILVMFCSPFFTQVQNLPI